MEGVEKLRESFKNENYKNKFDKIGFDIGIIYKRNIVSITKKPSKKPA